MQILIDTAENDRAEVFAIGQYLVKNFGPDESSREQFSSPSVTAQWVPFATTVDAPAPIIPPARPAFPVEIKDGPVTAYGPTGVDNGDDEPDVDTSEEIPSLSVSVSLPAAPPPPPPPFVPGPATSADVDKNGVPFDSRLHATGRDGKGVKKIGGEWRAKRGAPAPAAPTEAAAAPSPLVPPPPAPPIPAPPSPAAPLAASASVAPSTAAAPLTFRDLMVKIQTNTTSGKLNSEQVNAALLTVGLQPEQMAALIGNTALISAVNYALDAVLA